MPSGSNAVSTMRARSVEGGRPLDAFASESSLLDRLAVGDAGDGRRATPLPESAAIEAHPEAAIRVAAAARAVNAYRARLTQLVRRRWAIGIGVVAAMGSDEERVHYWH